MAPSFLVASMLPVGGAFRGTFFFTLKLATTHICIKIVQKLDKADCTINTVRFLFHTIASQIWLAKASGAALIL